ncbi:unnamed protein product [Thelazia callipaeda]|uniref:IRS-type PTB domain-containing protein n=1 Tax=Thelazia callipaeda TaxID=103827 RepID=A0A0N5D9J1_THECL|nr:unnamed protein product [Thelazia callipaeda]
MTAVRDSLCNLEPIQIPRPQISGLQFIPTRGRLGFYKEALYYSLNTLFKNHETDIKIFYTIRRDGENYGVEMKPIGPRRPVLSQELFMDNSAEKQSANTQKVVSDETENTINVKPVSGKKVRVYLKKLSSHNFTSKLATETYLLTSPEDKDSQKSSDSSPYPEPDYDIAESNDS